MDESAEKVCGGCQKLLPLDQFGIHRRYQKADGTISIYRNSRCRACKTKVAQAAYWKDPKRHRAGELRRKYGLEWEDYERMLSDQEGRCAICETPLDDTIRGPVVDHCHQTGTVRGLLCSDCNLGLGKFKDDPVRITEALNYLQRRYA